MNISLSQLPTNIAHLILSYVPTQEFSGQDNELTPEEHELVNSFKQLTAEQVCAHTFGQQRTPTSLLSDKATYARLLRSCYDSKIKPRAKLFMTYARIHQQVHCIVKNTAAKCAQPLHEELMNIQKQRAVLKNYQPQNAIQFKNLLHTLRNLQKLYIRYVELYQTQHGGAYQKFQCKYSTLPPQTISRALLNPAVEDIAYLPLIRTTYAVVGRFFSTQEYEVRAYHTGNKDAQVEKTYFYIVPPHEKHQFVWHLCSFSVSIGRPRAQDPSQQSVESSDYEAVYNDPRTLEVTLERAGKIDPHLNHLNQKLTQVMIEIMQQNQGISSINLQIHHFPHNSKTVCFTRDQLHIQTKFNGVTQVWGQTIAQEPILHATGSLIPEYWFYAPNIVPNIVSRPACRVLVHNRRAMHARIHSAAAGYFVHKHFPYI